MLKPQALKSDKYLIINEKMFILQQKNIYIDYNSCKILNSVRANKIILGPTTAASTRHTFSTKKLHIKVKILIYQL